MMIFCFRNILTKVFVIYYLLLMKTFCFRNILTQPLVINDPCFTKTLSFGNVLRTELAICALFMMTAFCLMSILMRN